MDKSTNTKVAQNYIDDAGVLSGKMEGNIKAREIEEMLRTYPERVYPEPEEQPQKKGGRGVAPAKPPPKPKGRKKKKEPPFPTPEWALELDDLVTTFKQMENLVSEEQIEYLELTTEFIDRVTNKETGHLSRFKKEIKFRRDEEEAKRIADEEKKKRKAAAKKNKQR